MEHKMRPMANMRLAQSQRGRRADYQWTSMMIPSIRVEFKSQTPDISVNGCPLRL